MEEKSLGFFRGGSQDTLPPAPAPLVTPLAIHSQKVTNQGENRHDFNQPGATPSTSAPMAFPSFQSVAKFSICRSGTLFWIQASRRCFGVCSLFWTVVSTSSSQLGIEME